jgi:hypothetical protein
LNPPDRDAPTTAFQSREERDRFLTDKPFRAPVLGVYAHRGAIGSE